MWLKVQKTCQVLKNLNKTKIQKLANNNNNNNKFIVAKITFNKI